MATLTGLPNAWSDHIMGPGEYDQEYRDMRIQEMYRLLQGMADWGRYVKLTEYDGTGIANELSSSDTSNGIGLDAYSQNVTYRLEIRNSGMNIHGAPTLHAFTEGSIPFIGPGGLLSQDNGNLYYDNTNNRLAVGNSAPADTLHVTGNARVTARMGVGGAPHASITFLVTGTAGVTSQMIVGASTLGAETFNVTGTAAVSSKLAVGAATVGAFTLGVTGTLDVSGATTLNAAVTLGDAAGDTITVTGTATFAEDVTMSKGLIVDTTTLVVDETLNFVGIGAAPASTDASFQVASAVRITNNTSQPSAGEGLELFYIPASDAGIISSRDRTGATYGILAMDGSSVRMRYQATSRIEVDVNGIGFFAATPAAQPDITGSRGGNAALADLLTSLETLGLITDSSTA